MYIKHQLEQTISQSSPSFSFGWESSPSIQNFETHTITKKKKKKYTDLLKSNSIGIHVCRASCGCDTFYTTHHLCIISKIHYCQHLKVKSLQ